MNIIFEKRGSGKTSKLIITSFITKYPIVCNNNVERDNILSMAKEMNISIPDPITMSDFCGPIGKGTRIKNILVDELDLEKVINFYFSYNHAGVNVAAVTITDPNNPNGVYDIEENKEV